MKRWWWSKPVRNNHKRKKNDSPIPLSLREEKVKNSTQKKRHHRNHAQAKTEHTSYPLLRLIERTFTLDLLWQSHVAPPGRPRFPVVRWPGLLCQSAYPRIRSAR